MFKPTTTIQLNNLEDSLKKFLEIIKDNNKYNEHDEYEAERVILEENIDTTRSIVRHKLESEFENRVDQETFKRLKRKYPFSNLNKNQTKKEKIVQKKNILSGVPKIIILTGTISGGKSTFGDKFKEFLENLNFKVYRPKEVSLQLSRELELFYKDVEKHALFFQSTILNVYKEKIKEINELTEYDYIIIERTHIDTEVFSRLNIKDQEVLDYLEEKRQEINLYNVHKVIYIKPSVENMLKRQKIRNRKGETTDEEYLTNLYSEYDCRIKSMYPSYILFENDCSKKEEHEFDEKCCLKDYEEMFSKLL
jgi:deoxyadenosine/deoxycytidine kinase